MVVLSDQLMKTSFIIHNNDNITGKSNLPQQNSLVITNEYCIPTIALIHHAPATAASKHSNWIVSGAIVDSLAEITEYVLEG